MVSTLIFVYPFSILFHSLSCRYKKIDTFHGYFEVNFCSIQPGVSHSLANFHSSIEFLIISVSFNLLVQWADGVNDELDG